MIFQFEAKLKYKNLSDVFIILDNLVSILKKLAIIDKKLIEDLTIDRVINITKLTLLFICLFLRLVLKQNALKVSKKFVIFLICEIIQSMIIFPIK